MAESWLPLNPNIADSENGLSLLPLKSMAISGIVIEDLAPMKSDIIWACLGDMANGIIAAIVSRWTSNPDVHAVIR